MDYRFVVVPCHRCVRPLPACRIGMLAVSVRHRKGSVVPNLTLSFGATFGLAVRATQ